MPASVLDFFNTDKYIMLFLTGNQTPSPSRVGITTVTRSSYDPDVVALFDDEYGIPEAISCSYYDFNVDDDVNLHGCTKTDPSFKCTKMELMWYSSSVASSYQPVSYHRAVYPAAVTIDDFRTTHDHGTRTGYYTGSWRVSWYFDGVLQRHNGPHTIAGNNLRHGDTNMVISSSWNHPSDNSIIRQADVETALRSNDINIDLLAVGDTVFENDLDVAAFYTTV